MGHGARLASLPGVRSADLGDGGDLVCGHASALASLVRSTWHVTGQKSGASALGLQRVFYRTAWNLLHKLRRAMVRPGRERLQGIIEVDEIFIGGPRPGKRGRGAHGKVLVVVAAQQAAKGIGAEFLKVPRSFGMARVALLPACAAA